MAITGFILGLIALFFNPYCLLSIPAITFSSIALGKQKNRGFAIAGLTIGIIAFCYNFIVTILQFM